jgi:hypothetical protein
MIKNDLRLEYATCSLFSPTLMMALVWASQLLAMRFACLKVSGRLMLLRALMIPIVQLGSRALMIPIVQLGSRALMIPIVHPSCAASLSLREMSIRREMSIGRGGIALIMWCLEHVVSPYTNPGIGLTKQHRSDLHLGLRVLVIFLCLRLRLELFEILGDVLHCSLDSIRLLPSQMGRLDTIIT